MNSIARVVLLVALAAPAQAANLTRSTVLAGGHPLALWARTVEKPRGVIVLIHGRTWSSLPDFDLQVPGRSVMQSLNAKGYSTREQAISDFISPAVIDQKTIDAYAAAALAADPVRTDWKALDQYSQLDPAKVTVPALLIQGERDPLALTDSQARLFTKLANPDRQWVVLAGGDHAALLEDTAPAFVAAIVSFVERPKLPKK